MRARRMKKVKILLCVEKNDEKTSAARVLEYGADVSCAGEE